MWSLRAKASTTGTEDGGKFSICVHVVTAELLRTRYLPESEAKGVHLGLHFVHLPSIKVAVWKTTGVSCVRLHWRSRRHTRFKK